MIFVTVGSMLPFDRLVQAVDALAASLPDETFVAQIGRSTYEPAHMRAAQILPADRFARTVAEASLIIAHAGMGSVITALEARRPIVVMPRRSALGEVTTDHQVATARWLTDKSGVYVATDEAVLPATVQTALADNRTVGPMSATAPSDFLAKIREFVLRD